MGVFDDLFRNLPHEERAVVDAFREVRVQEVFHLFQQGLGGGDPVGLALAGEVVGFIDRFGREHVYDRNGSARQGRHHLHVFDGRMGGVFQVNGIKKLFQFHSMASCGAQNGFYWGYDAQGGRSLSRTILAYKGSNDDILLNLKLFLS